MPWEHLGDVGTGELPYEREWVVFCHELALFYLRFACGPPPPGCELGIMWHEHELGEYPSIGIQYEQWPEQYAGRCAATLERFDEAVSWGDIELTQPKAT